MSKHMSHLKCVGYLFPKKNYYIKIIAFYSKKSFYLLFRLGIKTSAFIINFHP